MKFKEFLKNFCTSIRDGISRFSIAFICTILTFLAVSYEIIFESGSYEISVPLCMTFALVAVVSVVLKITQEYITTKLGSIIQYIVCIVSAITGFLLIMINYGSLYMVMAYTGIMIALVCFVFFFLMRGDNRDLVFPKLVSSAVFTAAVCGVLSSGLSTCIAAFQSLIFTWDDIYKLYLIANLFIWAVIFINVFLSFIPKKDVPIPQSKIFRAFVLFAGLPLYILLIAILLLYLAKIVITWNMPVGEINWFASFASLFFIFFLLSVMQYTEKIAKLFAKFGGYFLVPVLVMQAIAVFERINAYGLTTPRTVSLVLIVISILFIAGSVIIPRHLNKIALISGLIVLVVTITPLNVIDMPIASQANILKTVLAENDMLKDGQVVPNADISEEDAVRISSSYIYLKYDAKNVPDFIPDSEKSMVEIFGFEDPTNYYHEKDRRVYCSFRTKDSVDITDFDKMIKCDSNNIINVEHNSQQYEIDLKEIVKSLYTQYGESKNELDVYIVNKNISLYFLHLSADIESGEVVYCYFDGYVLLKD